MNRFKNLKVYRTFLNKILSLHSIDTKENKSNSVFRIYSRQYLPDEEKSVVNLLIFIYNARYKYH